MNYGFIKACAVSPALRVADCPYNAQMTIEAMRKAAQSGCQLAVFPELGLTGYTCSDLFLQQPLLDAAEQGLRDILVLWDCTQAEAAKRLGMAQPTLANKLRLLQLTGDQRQFVLDNNLTERHARAVLRLPENRRSEALINIAKRRLNARQTDLYIEQLLNSTAKGRHRISMVRDVRIFVNTIDHAIRLMTDNGVPATAHREEKDGYIEYTVRIPTAAAEK